MYVYCISTKSKTWPKPIQMHPRARIFYRSRSIYMPWRILLRVVTQGLAWATLPVPAIGINIPPGSSAPILPSSHMTLPPNEAAAMGWWTHLASFVSHSWGCSLGLLYHSQSALPMSSPLALNAYDTYCTRGLPREGCASRFGFVVWCWGWCS